MSTPEQDPFYIREELPSLYTGPYTSSHNSELAHGIPYSPVTDESPFEEGKTLINPLKPDLSAYQAALQRLRENNQKDQF